MQRFLFAILTAALVAGCAGRYSDDPRIAEIQKWSEACGQIAQAISTATMLNRAGQLTEPEAKVIDLVDRVYRPVCSGNPGPLGELLQQQGVRLAIVELCPELVSPAADLEITAAQIAVCVARRQLIEQLQTKG